MSPSLVFLLVSILQPVQDPPNTDAAMAKVDAINPETGEYRIVLQGTIDKEETRFEDT